MVVVESDNAERNRQFIERLAARVAAETNLFTDLFYKTDLTTLGPKALLLVPEKNLEEMRRTLHDNRPFLQQLAQATNLNSLFGLINQQFLTANGQQNAGADFVIRSIPALQRIVEQGTHSCSTPGTPPSPGSRRSSARGTKPASDLHHLRHGRIYLADGAGPQRDEFNAAAIERLRQFIQANPIRSARGECRV